MSRIWPALLIIVGVILGSLVQSDFGRVDVRDVRFVGAGGNLMSGLLYIPGNASVENPAPGILAVHGYINSRETQSSFAIELARRGYVVLALDQTGHGYSEAPAFAHGFGGPDGLRYLRSLPFVDTSRIGLEGHSMGGWTVQAAAAAMPDDYNAMVLTGSSTGTFGVPEGTSTHPRNLLLVFSLWDEFSELMWGASVPADIVSTEKLKTLFGTEDTVVPGQRYGNLADGTARVLSMPPVTHPGDHLSMAVTADTVTWFDETLGAPVALDPDDQNWYWKELGTCLALIGFAGLALQLLSVLVPRGNMAAGADLSGTARKVSVGIAAVVPIILFFPLNTIANVVLPANPLLPQQITNGILLWALVSGLVSIGWLKYSCRESGFELGSLAPRDGLVAGLRTAVVVFLILYLVALIAGALFTVDFRFWVVALKTLSVEQIPVFLFYLPLFFVYFLVLSVCLHADERRMTAAQNGCMLAGGFVVLLLVQYIPLLMGGTLAIASQPLLTIVAFQFVPILFFVGVVSTVCFQRSGNVWAGASINALLITWYVCAGTATQVVPLFS